MAYSVPKITNVSLTTVNTEVSQALQAFTRYFEVRARQLADLKVAFITGQSGTTYFTIPAGSTWTVKEPLTGIVTLYMQSPVANVTAEIIEWR